MGWACETRTKLAVVDHKTRAKKNWIIRTFDLGELLFSDCVVDTKFYSILVLYYYYGKVLGSIGLKVSQKRECSKDIETPFEQNIEFNQ